MPGNRKKTPDSAGEDKERGGTSASSGFLAAPAKGTLYRHLPARNIPQRFCHTKNTNSHGKEKQPPEQTRDDEPPALPLREERKQAFERQGHLFGHQCRKASCQNGRHRVPFGPRPRRLSHHRRQRNLHTPAPWQPGHRGHFPQEAQRPQRVRPRRRRQGNTRQRTEFAPCPRRRPRTGDDAGTPTHTHT